MKNFEGILSDTPLNPEKNELVQIKILSSNQKDLKAVLGLTKEEAERLKEFLNQILK